MEYFKEHPFELERFFAIHEFSAPHLLCCSDCAPLTVDEVLALAVSPGSLLASAGFDRSARAS